MCQKDGFDAEKDRLETLNELDRMRGELHNTKNLDNIRHKYVYQTLLWDKLLDHKIRHPECKPDYRELDYVRKYVSRDGVDAETPSLPDWEKKNMTNNAVKVDNTYINYRKLDDRNDKMIRSLNEISPSTDELDKNLFSGLEKNYQNAGDSVSRYGGLQIGNHKDNYNK